jgi:hypothetical protein
MEIGGKKYIKTQKTKFRKNLDKDKEEFNLNNKKQRKHDKTFYRLLKNEDTMYDA